MRVSALFAIFATLGSASAFAPATFGVRQSSSLMMSDEAASVKTGTVKWYVMFCSDTEHSTGMMSRRITTRFYAPFSNPLQRTSAS
jgi:hypothetical protein